MIHYYPKKQWPMCPPSKRSLLSVACLLTCRHELIAFITCVINIWHTGVVMADMSYFYDSRKNTLKYQGIMLNMIQPCECACPGAKGTGTCVLAWLAQSNALSICKILNKLNMKMVAQIECFCGSSKRLIYVTQLETSPAIFIYGLVSLIYLWS